MNDLLAPLVALALAAALLALGAWLYPRLKRERQDYPFEREIESVILPLIHQAVHAVHEMTISRLREIGEAEMPAEQKQALFAELYRLLVPAKLKRYVPLDTWMAWGQDVYDEGRTVVIDYADHLETKLQEWEAEAQPLADTKLPAA